jgi:hypothetical protein
MIEAENITQLMLRTVFGEDMYLLGLIATVAFSALIVLIRPPGIVSAISVGIFLLLFFGGATGTGAIPLVGVAVAILFGLILYFSMKKPVRGY